MPLPRRAVAAAPSLLPALAPAAARPAAAPEAAKRALALAVHQRLCAEYGCPVAYFQSLSPLDELVSSLLSHRTRNRDSHRAYESLRATFADWAAVRDAPVEEVERAIAGVTWPEAKAPALQRVLRTITERRGGLDLSHLETLPEADAAAWLAALPGVGPKTVAAVLSFSTLRRRALPVDSHHHRVAQRLGLIPASCAVGPSHALLLALLPEDWDAQQVYDDHQVMMRHGQRRCFFRNPDCAGCVLLDLCPTGRARTGAAPA